MNSEKITHDDTVKDSDHKEPLAGTEDKKYDPTARGPINKRGCTDIICCIVFIVFLFGMVVFGALGFSQGNPRQLILPRDSEGRICGMDDQVGKSSLFYFDLTKCIQNIPATVALGCPTRQVCVTSCPTEYNFYLALEALEVIDKPKARSKLICRPTVDAATDTRSIDKLVSADMCASYTLESAAVLGRCVPKAISDAVSSVANVVQNGVTFNITSLDGVPLSGEAIKTAQEAMAKMQSAKEIGEKLLQDFTASWPFILAAYGLAVVVSFLWIVIMRCIAKPMVYLTCLAVLGLLGFGTYYCFSRYIALKNSQGANATNTLYFTTNVDIYLQNQNVWLAFGSISAIVLGVLILIFLFLLKRIRIALSLIKEGSKAVGGMMSTLIWPLFPFVLQIAVVAYWLGSTVYIASSGKPLYVYNGVPNNTGCAWVNGQPCNPKNFTADTNCTGSYCNFKGYGYNVSYPFNQYLPQAEVYFTGVLTFLNQYTWIPQVYNLFGFFWLMFFVQAVNQCVLAGAFASYYWAFDKSTDLPRLPLLSSIGRTLFYHTGSLAFGSFILAVIRMIRVMLEYLDHKLKGRENMVAKFFLKCLKCCFWCFEKCMKFLTKNAYIMIAVYGSNFCVSAKKAFFLILANIVRAVVVDKVTDFLLFIGKAMVVAGVAVFAWYFFSGSIPIQQFKEVNPALNFPPVTVTVIALGTYVIASCFFGVYEMAVDTLFLCFLEDLEINDGTPAKPYFMSKELMSVLGKTNKVVPGPHEAGKGETVA